MQNSFNSSSSYLSLKDFLKFPFNMRPHINYSHSLFRNGFDLTSPCWRDKWNKPNFSSLFNSSQSPCTSQILILIHILQIWFGFEFSRSIVSDSLQPHGLEHARPPCPSPTPRIYSNSCPLRWWCHLTISSCHPLLLPSVFPSSRVFSSESALHIR